MTQQLARLALDVPAFDDHDLTLIELGGKRAWLASEVATALGYADPRAINRAIRNPANWGAEFDAGIEYDVLEGDELAALKRLVPDSVTSRAPAATVLYEPGMWAVLQLTRQDKGVEFRRYWRRVVMPALDQLEAGGAVVDMQGQPLAPVEASSAPSISQQREARLLAREERLAAVERRKSAQDFREALARLEAAGVIDQKRAAHYLVQSLEYQLDTTLNELRPAQEQGSTAYLSPTRIARAWGISAQAVGRAITAATVNGHAVRNHPNRRICRVLIKSRLHTDGDARCYEYGPRAIQEIRRTAVRLGYLSERVSS